MRTTWSGSSDWTEEMDCRCCDAQPSGPQPPAGPCRFEYIGPECGCPDCLSAAQWIAADVGFERTADAAERGEGQ